MFVFQFVLKAIEEELGVLVEKMGLHVGIPVSIYFYIRNYVCMLTDHIRVL